MFLLPTKVSTNKAKTEKEIQIQRVITTSNEQQAQQSIQIQHPQIATNTTNNKTKTEPTKPSIVEAQVANNNNNNNNNSNVGNEKLAVKTAEPVIQKPTTIEVSKPKSTVADKQPPQVQQPSTTTVVAKPQKVQKNLVIPQFHFPYGKAEEKKFKSADDTKTLRL